MQKVKISENHVSFKCPGCNDIHDLPFKPGEPSGWEFNGDVEKPTIRPSILTTSGHYTKYHRPGDSCWCKTEDAQDTDGVFCCYRCHSFVTDGMIQFLDDCTHDLAGQTVELKDVT